MSARPKRMSKTHRAMLIEVMEVLKTNDCVAGYTITEQGVTPQWKEGGTERAFQQLVNNPAPFGLKKQRAALLLIILPQEDKKRFDAIFMRRLRERCGL